MKISEKLGTLQKTEVLKDRNNDRYSSRDIGGYCLGYGEGAATVVFAVS